MFKFNRLYANFPRQKANSLPFVTSYQSNFATLCIQFSLPEGGIEEKEKDDKEPPILLLPTSTTYTDFQSNDDNNDSSFTPIDEYTSMDVELNSNTQVYGRNKRLASGLNNMGNTCFMNSTLQCLAHTEPIRTYFLSGEYTKDLNRENPLGTGGELATQFANLIGEMWGVSSKRRNVIGGTQNWNNTNQYSTTSVYPRTFKSSLGKHAEQFMGYDQHDSQELATYLLDALHEDTNRVTKKPFIKKPEQNENESDASAANMAWAMHLKREDSRVLENFMGQVKSRLECSVRGCVRVSTTFDPFMYLTVPIPGEMEVARTVIFVPLDSNKRMQKLTLTLNKSLTITGLLEKLNEELVRTRTCTKPIPLPDLCTIDMSNNKVFKWYKNEDSIDRIRDFDETYVYQLRPLEEIQKIMSLSDDSVNDTFNDLTLNSIERIKLDQASRTLLNEGDQWKDELEKYSSMPDIAMARLLNVKRSSTKEKIKYHEKLHTFLNSCYKELEKEEFSGLKRTREDDTKNSDTKNSEMQCASINFISKDAIIQGLNNCEPPLFPDVKTKNDVGVLDFCFEKLRELIINQIRDEKDKLSDGLIVQVGFKAVSPLSNFHSRQRSLLAPPLIIRLAANSSVFSLRIELAQRLSRSLHDENMTRPTAEELLVEPPNENNSTTEPECCKLRFLRTIPLTLKKNEYMNYSPEKMIGMIEPLNNDTVYESVEIGGNTQIAVPSNENEQASIRDVLGSHETILLNFSQDDDSKVFDESEFNSVDEPQNDELKDDRDVTVLDCIEKYCQKEKLEETEMWYCNKCQNHVRAWKQFHLYRTPPILIIHLKRFYFSPSTHRRDKITKKIDFPLKGLDLSTLVAEYSDDEKPLYDCYAVSNHFGGLGGGHYTAFILSDDGTWCDYDDSHITTNIDPERVVSSNAYVLYYRRQDVHVGQDTFDQAPILPMVCDRTDHVSGEASELSTSSNSDNAQSGDMDLTLDDLDSTRSTGTNNSDDFGNRQHTDADETGNLPLQ